MDCPTCGFALDAGAACPRCGRVPPNATTPSTTRPDPWPGPGPDPRSGVGFTSPAAYAAAHPSSTGGPPSPGPAFQGQPGFVPAPAWTTAAAPAPRRRRLLPVLLVALALVLTGGGSAVAGAYLGWFGAGPQAADLVPGTAVSYLQVDLNPSLVQKASAWQFLRDLPQVQKAVASGRPDPKAIAWELVDVPDGPLSGLDYARDVKPWLGDRLAVAAVPRDSGAAAPLLVVQVTDEAKAATTLRAWARRAPQAYDVTTRDGYALLTDPDDTAFLLGQLESAGPLSAQEAFTAEVAGLGEAGVLSGWADLAGAARLTGEGDPARADVRGRAVFSLTFTADTMTLEGRATGLAGTGTAGTADLGELPASTVGALGFADGGRTLERALPTVQPHLDEWLDGVGLDQADLVALLGRSFAAGVATSAAGPGDPADLPAFGVRITSDDVERARTALAKLVPADAGFPIVSRTAGDVLLVSTSEDYLAQLAAPAVTLAGAETFRTVLPDHAEASASGYVDLAAVMAQAQVPEGEYQDFLEALRGIGSQYVAEGTDAGSWMLRVVRS